MELFGMGPVIFGLITSLIGIGYVLYLVRSILRLSPGSDKLREISLAIQGGAKVFMKRELKTIGIFTAVIAPVLLLALRDDSGFALPLKIVLAFVAGVAVSGTVGYLSMIIATRANARVTNLAINSFPAALKGAFSGGAVMGFGVVSFGLLGLTALYLFFSDEPEVLLGYAFGASSVALFLRVGGGIFTKSADVGADLVGKVEKSIPEDDPRNPATIADNVGDNVGDIAGMGSDLFESYVSAVIAAVFLGFLINDDALKVLPLFLAGTGILAAMAGSFFVRSGKAGAGFERQMKAAKNALNKGVYVASVLMIVAGYFVIYSVVGDDARYSVNEIFIAMVTGLVSGFLIGKITEFFTSGRVVKEIAEASGTPGTNIISGLSSGMLSTVPPVIVVVIATLIAYQFAGLYGIAIASVGMLVTLGMILAVDGYGPIVDNAAGNSRDGRAWERRQGPRRSPGRSRKYYCGNRKGVCHILGSSCCACVDCGLLPESRGKNIPAGHKPCRARSHSRTVYRRNASFPVFSLNHAVGKRGSLKGSEGGQAPVQTYQRSDGRKGKAGLWKMR